MLSTIAIIGIFTEIFASGILLAGTLTLLKKYIQEKKLEDLFSSLAFFLLFIFVACTIASQLLFNYGQDLSTLISIHKLMYVCLVLASSCLWFFIFERFKLAKTRWGYPPVILLVLFFVFRIIYSSVSLIYREGVIEPIVDLSMRVPAEPLFGLVALVLAIVAFTAASKQKDGARKLSQYLGIAALLFLLALFSKLFYIRFAEGGYLLLSWFSILFASLTFLLAELTSAENSQAASLLRFFRTRLLFKLLLVFVLLIVILFETTTLATMSMSKQALSESILNNYHRIAEEVSSKLRTFAQKPNPEELERAIAGVKTAPEVSILIVDDQGRLVFHPDQKRAIQQEDLSNNQAVNKVIRGQEGEGEFRDELGSLMVGAFMPVNRYGLSVVVEAPMEIAYYELRKLETNSLLFVIFGIVITALVGIFFANSIERPIKHLTNATEAVAKGDLRWQVKVETVDEIGKLAAAFNQMTKDLRESQERLILSEKLASLGTMAAGMAHEIKNPLVSVRTFTQMLDKKWDDPEFRKKFMNLIPQEITRINRIAESLLKFGRPMKPELTHADINSLLDEVLLLFESESKKHKIRVTKKFAHLPEVMGDPGQLQQAFVNFIKNAIESMYGKGKGELIVKTEIGEVVKLGKLKREGRKRGDEMVWGEEENMGKPVPAIFIEITDTGEGISEENLKSLFDPFFTTKMTGTGMGLPITMRIIEEHGGSVKVKSQPGKGTSFIITLPQKLPVV